MASVFLLLVFFIDCRGVSDKHCLCPFFILVDSIHRVFLLNFMVGEICPNSLQCFSVKCLNN